MKIFIYSKYSSNCKQFFEIIQRSNVDFTADNLKLLCVDNEKIRPFILNNKKIQLGIVPTILIIFTNGVVEKYEGHTAFNWLESIILKHKPPMQEKSIIHVQPELEKNIPQPQLIQEKNIKEKIKRRKTVKFEDEEVTNIEDVEDIKDMEDEEYETESEPEEDEIPLSNPERKYQRMRTGAGSETYNDKLFKDPKPIMGQIPTGSIRGDDRKSKISSIMAQAQAMQKQRDKIEENNPPKGKRPPVGGQRF
jgi:hypothetical protein